MTETLVEIIRSIENISDSVGINKKELIRKTWKEWEKKNKLVRERTQGNTTFLKEYQDAYDKYDGLRPLLPSSLPKNFEEKVVYLVDCIGDPNFYKGTNTILANPLGMAGLMAAVFAGLDKGVEKLVKNKPKMNRRKFIKNSVADAAIIGAAAGGVAGMGLSFGSMSELKSMKANAKYLDNIYNKYIH